MILYVFTNVAGLTADAGTENGINVMLLFVKNLHSTGTLPYFPFDGSVRTPRQTRKNTAPKSGLLKQ